MGGRPYPYIELPILEAARRCGLVLDEKTVGREEVEASCPFCRDHGPGKHHLSLNTRKNVYRCNLCGAHGNSVSLYARLEGVDYRQAFKDLCEAGGLYRFPEQPQKPPEREPAPLSRRHDVYYDMLSHLELSRKHREDLLRRGLSEERIRRNMYRTLPGGRDSRRLLAGMLADFNDLVGIPGFRVEEGCWTIAGKSGLLVPYCDRDGYIQGLQVRLDDEASPKRKYRWLSSRGMEYGTRSLSWIHVTGDREARTAYLTEGGLKGDVASFLDGDALFLCFAGVSAIGGLKEVLKSLPNVAEAVIALDMDKLMNPHVRQAVDRIKALVRPLGLRVRLMNWNMSFKGVDDFYQARNYAAGKGVDIMEPRPNHITHYLDGLWARKHPGEDSGFIHACEWEEVTLPLSALDCCPDTGTPRVDASDPSPLVCVNGTVIDGQERFLAYQDAGVKDVTVYQNKPWALPAAA